MKKLTLIASCAFGIEKLVKFELFDLGCPDIKVSDGKLEFEAEIIDICRCNINLRTANRVFIKLGEFSAFTFDELFENTKKIDFASFIPKNAEFPVSKVSSVKSKLFAKSSVQSIVKKAIVENLKHAHGTPVLPENGAMYSIHVHIKNDIVSILLDTSGESLNRRGYREKGNRAPLKETLAAALVKLSGWRPNKDILYDPFCGSGTILIEAALIGANVAPGLKRSFVSENFDFISPEEWKDAQEEADAKIIDNIDLKIMGSDIDEKAIKLSKENSRIAGTKDFIKFFRKALSDITAPADYGIIVCNPPYGERLLEEKEAFNLYREMGQIFKEKFPDWDYFILTSHPDFERAFGRKADRNRKLYNGKLMCYLYQYFKV